MCGAEVGALPCSILRTITGYAPQRDCRSTATSMDLLTSILNARAGSMQVCIPHPPLRIFRKLGRLLQEAKVMNG
jgi:hypothetical protein